MSQTIRRHTQPSLYQVEQQTIREYIAEHIRWSTETFGEGPHLEGLLKHIEKEINEVRDCYYDGTANLATETDVLMELTDIVILTIDAMWRMGFSAEQVVSALIEKQNINKKRKYPKITDPDQPTEHIREEDNEPD